MNRVKHPSQAMIVIRHMLSSKWFVSILAVLIAFLIGALLIVMTGASVADAYYAMFRGAIYDPEAATFARRIKPLTNSFFYAIPLIIGGLGLAFSFRAGLFNIGGRGQLIFGALAAVWVGFRMDFPPVIHTLVVLCAAMIAGALYAGIAGVLKAKTGANEVIVTIMLNSIATLALGYILAQEAWQVPGSNQPKTPDISPNAAFAQLLPAPFRIHAGLIVAIIAVIVFWWVIERSTLGFEIKAVEANPDAARTAGISVSKITIIAMLISGAFLGLAGANEVLGTLGYVSRDIAGSIGFDAITVALLGRNKPIGTFCSGLLFGAFKAGGYVMQPKGVPIDMILILQSVIVLLIAAPALIRWLFHLPQPGNKTLRDTLAVLSQDSSMSTATHSMSATARTQQDAGLGDDAATDADPADTKGASR